MAERRVMIAAIAGVAVVAVAAAALALWSPWGGTVAPGEGGGLPDGVALSEDGLRVPAHELWVMAEDGRTFADLESVVEDLGCTVLDGGGGSDAGYGVEVPAFAEVRLPDGADVHAMREAFLEREEVECCNYLQEIDDSAMSDADREQTVTVPDGRLVYKDKLDVTASRGVLSEDLTAAVERAGCSMNYVHGGPEDKLMPDWPCYGTASVPEGLPVWDARDWLESLPEVASCKYLVYIGHEALVDCTLEVADPGPAAPTEPTAVLV